MPGGHIVRLKCNPCIVKCCSEYLKKWVSIVRRGIYLLVGYPGMLMRRKRFAPAFASGAAGMESAHLAQQGWDTGQ